MIPKTNCIIPNENKMKVASTTKEKKKNFGVSYAGICVMEGGG